jgi:hypothetical protein
MLKDRMDTVINSLNDVIQDNQDNEDLVNELSTILNEIVDIGSICDSIELDRKLKIA